MAHVKHLIAKKPVKKKLFKVITVTTFKNVYYIEAECAEYVADTITCQEAEWDDMQGETLDESIVLIEPTKDKVKTVQGCNGPVFVKE